MTDNPLADIARQKMKTLSEMGWQAYNNQRGIEAMQYFRQALLVAEGLNSIPDMIRLRLMYGVSLHNVGSLREALAALGPLLQTDGLARDPSADPAEIYRALTRYIGIAIDLPSRLSAIENVIHQAEQYLQDIGHPEWRHRLLTVQADLLMQRGLYQEALSKDREAWMCWTGDYPSFTADAHLRQMTWISYLLQDTGLVRNFLAEWEHVSNNPQPAYRERYIALFKASLALIEGRFDEALDAARRYRHIVSGMTDYAGVDDTAIFIRACLCGSAFQMAGAEIVTNCSFHRGQSLHDVYALHLIRGDYHLACTRKAASMPPIDDETGTTFPVPTRIADPVEVRQGLKRARRAYGMAARVGQQIDTLLECTWRQEKIQARLARIAAVEDICNAQE